MTLSRRSSLLALAGALALAGPLAAPAQAQIKLKMVLNWKYQGPQGWFFLAEDRGYFKAEGLDITIDQGECLMPSARSSFVPDGTCGVLDAPLDTARLHGQLTALPAVASAARRIRTRHHAMRRS